jgi:YD repeat-containing protein
MHDPDKGGFLGNASASCESVVASLATTGNSPVGWWAYKYNDFGELTEQIDTKKQMTRMDYDSLGRMIRRWDLNGGVESFTRWYFDANIGETAVQQKNQRKP